MGLYGVTLQLLSLSSLITLPLVTKKMGVDIYGVMTLGTTIGGILIYFVFWSIPPAFIRSLSGMQDKHRISTDFTTGLLITTFSGLFWGFSSIWLAKSLATGILGSVEYTVIVKLTVFKVISESWILILMTYFRITGKNIKFIIVQNILSLTTISANIIVIVLTYNIIAYFWVGFIISTLQAFVLAVIFFKEVGFAKPDFRAFVPYLKFCLPLLIPQLSSWIIQYGDRYMLKSFMDTAAVGKYNASYQIGRFSQAVVSTVMFVYSPLFYKYWNEGKLDKLRDLFSESSKIMMFLLIPLVVGSTVLAQPMMRILSTDEIAEVALFIVPFSAMSWIFYAFNAFGGNVFLFKGNSLIHAFFVSTAAFLNILFNILLIPRYGILGASLATIIAYAFLGIVPVLMSKKHFTYSFAWGEFTKYLFCSILMGAVLWYLQPEEIAQVALSIILGIAIYFTLAKILNIIPFSFLTDP